MEAIIDKPSDYELERGKPMPTTVHAAIQTNIAAELSVRYRKTYRILTEITLATLPKDSVPDVALYPYFQLDYQHDTASRIDAPLIAIEIISPSQSISQMIEKIGRYFAFGVQSCWIVIPDMKAIAVYSSPTTYQFFMGNDVVRDNALAIDLPLEVVFEYTPSIFVREDNTNAKTTHTDDSVELTDEIFSHMSKPSKILANLHTMYGESSTRVVKNTSGTNISYTITGANLEELIKVFDM